LGVLIQGKIFRGYVAFAIRLRQPVKGTQHFQGKEINNEGVREMPLAKKETMVLGKLKFTPPVGRKKDLPKYMSYVPGGIDCVARLHHAIGDAKNSVRNRAWQYRGGEPAFKESYILEMVEGEWFVLYYIPDGTTESTLPWKTEVTYASYRRNPDYVSYTETPNESTFVRDEKTVMVTRPMTADEYADWRVAVDRELRYDAGYDW
jgi:hypothetical protein